MKGVAKEKYLQGFIDKQRKELKDLKSQYKELTQKYYSLISEKDTLSTRVLEQEDWIMRLLNYTDLTKEDLAEMKKIEIAKEQTTKNVDRFVGMCSTLIKCMNI